MPVTIEGYAPPRDPRLSVLMVTPDPGVIEVNVHPAAELARARRADRHALRGSAADAARHREVHAGRPPHGHRRRQSHHARRRDAGGQPVAAPSRPASQPRHLLAEPSVAVVSVLRTCSSGRPARRRAWTRRATTACTSSRSRSSRWSACTSRATESPQPWLVDRLLRNLLTDLTGNTHRAEFSIDKLYSPDSATGRLGLLEFRAFEMPPHPRMSLVQMLLLRALVARFWREPYRGRLIPWGTALHDRWLLPHFVAADLHDVVADLRPRRLPVLAGVVRSVRRVPLPALRHRELRRHHASSCVRRSSPGTCWARRSAAAARRAMSTRRSSDCR